MEARRASRAERADSLESPDSGPFGVARARAVGRVLLGVLLLLGACDRGPQPAAEPARGEHPDLILISIDSLRADHLGCYGYDRPTSPVIDRLAGEGVRCAEAISSTSWTLPSHAAIFTGLQDSAHGVTDPSRRLAAARVTLAERLRDAGYQTAGFYGAPFLHPVFGLDQGFETWQSCMGEIPDGMSREEVLSAMSPERAVMHGDVTGPRTLAAVEEWCADADERPCFLFVHLWDVHYDYLAPPEYVERFDPGYEGPIDGLHVEDLLARGSELEPRDLRHLLALYDAEIRFTDEILGRLLDALERSGRFDDALVVVTADHGEEFLDHGRIGHQVTLYDEVVHVPLIFHWPGHLAAGRVVEQQVSLVSLAPALLDLLGLPATGAGERAHERADATDLVDLLRGGHPAPRPALAELLVDQPLYALRSADLKVLYEPGHPTRVYGFDLVRDPLEEHRLGLRDDERIPRAVMTLESMLHAQGAAEGEANAGLDPELRRRLESIGYLGGEDAAEEQR